MGERSRTVLGDVEHTTCARSGRVFSTVCRHQATPSVAVARWFVGDHARSV